MNSSVFWETIEKNKNIGIFFKNNPNTDQLGAALALKKLLEKSNKNVQIIGDRGNKLRWFDVEKEFNKWWNGNEEEQDLAIVIGSPEKIKVSRFEQLTKFKTKMIINNFFQEDWGEINICCSFPSNCELIHNLFVNNGEIDGEIASYLLLGIYYSSTTFLNENIVPESFRIAHELMGFGPDMKRVTKTFLNDSYLHEKLYGDILSKSHLKNNGILILNITTSQVYEHMPHMYGKLKDSRNQSEILRISGRFKKIDGVRIIVSIFYDIFNPKNKNNRLILVECLENEYIDKIINMGFTYENEQYLLRGKLSKYCNLSEAVRIVNTIIGVCG